MKYDVGMMFLLVWMFILFVAGNLFWIMVLLCRRIEALEGRAAAIEKSHYGGSRNEGSGRG